MVWAYITPAVDPRPEALTVYDSSKVAVVPSERFTTNQTTAVYFSQAAVKCGTNFTELERSVQRWIASSPIVASGVRAGSVRAVNASDDVVQVDLEVTTAAAWTALRVAVSAGEICTEIPVETEPCARVTADEVPRQLCNRDHTKVVQEQIQTWGERNQQWLAQPIIIACVAVMAVLLAIGLIALTVKKLTAPGPDSGRAGTVLLRLTDSPFFIPSEPVPVTSAAYSPMYAEIAIDPRKPSVWSGANDEQGSAPATPRRHSAPGSPLTTPLGHGRRGTRYSMSVTRSPMAIRTQGTDSVLCEAGMSRWHSSTPTRDSPRYTAADTLSTPSPFEEEGSNVHLM